MNITEHSTKAKQHQAGSLSDWITLAEACSLMGGGKGIKPKSMRNKIYKNQFPEGAVRKSLRGNYFFHKPTLMGLA